MTIKKARDSMHKVENLEDDVFETMRLFRQDIDDQIESLDIGEDEKLLIQEMTYTNDAVRQVKNSIQEIADLSEMVMAMVSVSSPRGSDTGKQTESKIKAHKKLQDKLVKLSKSICKEAISQRKNTEIALLAYHREQSKKVN